MIISTRENMSNKNKSTTFHLVQDEAVVSTFNINTFFLIVLLYYNKWALSTCHHKGQVFVLPLSPIECVCVGGGG